MILLFIIGLFLGAVAVMFALQNVMVVTVTFFQWHITSSLAVIFIAAMLGGILFTLLLVLPESVSSYFKSKRLKKEILGLQEELRKQKQLTVFAKNIPPPADVIHHLEETVSARE